LLRVILRLWFAGKWLARFTLVAANVYLIAFVIAKVYQLEQRVGQNCNRPWLAERYVPAGDKGKELYGKHVRVQTWAEGPDHRER
jgi:hypothetical protein